MLTRRRAERAATQQRSPPSQSKFRITIVETTTANEVQLCSGCTHRVSELQHDDAAFALKLEVDGRQSDDALEEAIEEIDAAENGIEDYSDVENGFNKDADTSDSRSLSKRRSKRSTKNAKRKAVANVPVEEPPAIVPPKAVFPESEYDVLEKRLIQLESDLANELDNDRFKKLCKMGVMCEERWAKLYCKDYGKSWEDHRNEAISVLKHNLEIRREGLQPFMKMCNKLDGDDLLQGTMRRDINGMNPPVSIGMSRLTNPHEMLRNISKRVFATCTPIHTLTVAPMNNYSHIEEDPCFQIENDLFEVEHKLKRCDPDTSEFTKLVEHGRRLRENWRLANEAMKRTKPAEAEPPGYDIRKCIVVGRNRKQVRDNGELIVHATAEELEDIDITH
ncbi:hypothetical protein M3Y95_01187500 [Aphelenchoides besseyi]|nr:hypothetical protein M3Y95_01187500 [Aphelenchoides besseyi]